MNPYSPQCVAERARLHGERVAQRDRLAAEAAKINASLDADLRLSEAEALVRGSLSRMEAMGDPLPSVSIQSPGAGICVAPSPRPLPAAATLPLSASEQGAGTPSPVDLMVQLDAIAKRIAEA